MPRVYFYDWKTGKIATDDYDNFYGYCVTCNERWHEKYLFKKVNKDNICSRCLLEWDKFSLVYTPHGWSVEPSNEQCSLAIVVNGHFIHYEVLTKKPSYYIRRTLSSHYMEACYIVRLT